MKLTKERIAGMKTALAGHYNREFKGREPQVLETLVWNQIQILDHMFDAMLEAEAPKPKPERCGGTPGKPRWQGPGFFITTHSGWHPKEQQCEESPECRLCPGCPDCAPKVDWALTAAEEWLCTGGAGGGSSQERLAAIIRRHAP